MGIDIGWDDADAIAILAYSNNSEHVYVVEEWVHAKQDITALADQIKIMQKHYNPSKMVMDAGALGKKIQEEIRNRHALPVEAAEKKRKLEFIKLLNDDLQTGKLKYKEDSIAAEDYNMIQWDADKSTNGKMVISTIFHSDISDAVLYAWREARHYSYEAPEPEPERDTDSWMDREEERKAEKMEREQSGDDTLEPLYDLNEIPWWDR